MLTVVFILGVGASKECGALLMADFLHIASHLYRTGPVGNKKADFKRVFNAIGALQSVHSKCQLDVTNAFGAGIGDMVFLSSRVQTYYQCLPP